MEYRPFPDERADEFGAFMRYTFSPAEGPYDPDEAEDHDPIAERRGLFDAADDPVAVCAHHFFPLRIRGVDREVAGLSAVASRPEHRRQGNVGRMLRESLAEYRDRDVAVADDEAWFQLLRFCRNHDSQVGAVRIRALPDAPFLDLVDAPRAVDCEIRAGPMARLVDVAAALEALDPDPGTEATLSLAVDDPLVAWNDAVFRVTVAEGAVAVERFDADPADSDAAVDVGTLSQLYVGYRSVDDAVRAGRLSGGAGSADARPASDGVATDGGTALDDGAVAALRALFPPRTTHLREGF